MLEADRRALKQVFLNLLSNAVKFTRDGGSVDVHLSRSRGHVKIAIKDTGIGIPEADIAKLGRPFEQVENQFSKSHQGSGLGLAISRALVELHGGSLAHHQPRGPGHHRHLHAAGAPGDRRRRAQARRLSLSSRHHLTMRSKASCTAASVSFNVASSVAKSGMSAARASRSFSARGASSATNGLSRHSLQALG